MRTIKFRAWDWKKKKLTPVFYLDWTTTTYTPNLKKINSRKESDFKLMQFTGLLDKNGKEIYEGDILQNVTTAIVSFKDGAFVVGEFGVSLKQFAGENKEVIGNIYENKELLK